MHIKTSQVTTDFRMFKWEQTKQNTKTIVGEDVKKPEPLCIADGNKEK